MMLNCKDRRATKVGSRSFFPLTNIVIIVSALLLFFCWYSTRLVLAVVPEGITGAFAFSTHRGDEWNISFTHSVEKTEWDEYFKVNAENDMTMTHTRFESLGWGYPYSPADGKLTQLPDGRFNLEMNRPYKEVALRISEQAMQHLIHGKDDYDLIAMYGQGTAIKIKVIYRYQYWQECYFNFL